MHTKERLYQVAKRAVDMLPASVLRLRPFRVYAIPLVNDVANANPCHDGGPAPYNDARWLTTRTELEAVATIADRENVASWDGSARRAVVAWRASEPVGAAWIATRCFEERQLGLRFELASDEAWLHSAAVVPEHRRQGVYRHLLDFVIRSLAVEGRRRLLLGVATGNEPSRRAHEAMGAAGIGHVAAARVCGLTACSTAGKVYYGARGRVAVGTQVKLQVVA